VSFCGCTTGFLDECSPLNATGFTGEDLVVFYTIDFMLNPPKAGSIVFRTIDFKKMRTKQQKAENLLHKMQQILFSDGYTFHLLYKVQ
jgi:hypothetical protein